MYQALRAVLQVESEDLHLLACRAQEQRPLPPEKLWQKYERDPQAHSKGRADWARLLLSDPEHILTLKQAYSSPGLAFEHLYALIESEMHEAQYAILRSNNEAELAGLRARYVLCCQLLSIPAQMDRAEELADSLLHMGEMQPAGSNGFLMTGETSQHEAFDNPEELDSFRFFR